jgi:hypothetical protein
MLVLPEGQTGEAWLPYKKVCSVGKKVASGLERAVCLSLSLISAKTLT